ncbi:MAG: (2Fe-2S)-binding protein [Bacteroidales bacterium]|nr:(2Fe-2S)-binding protein [Bacteroidales bacterium]
MVKLKIDNREVEAEIGSVLIDVIRGEGTEVPSMCYLKDAEHFTSCMVCVVKDKTTGTIIPSCSLKAEEGMDIISMDEEVQEARKTALELLLSEHVGDCEAPCQITCPAHMDIPLMNRLLAEGKFLEALKVVKKDIALPSVLGRICPAPCEGACRRKSIDEPISICLLKRFAGDCDIGSDAQWIPENEPDTGKQVTIIGAGPAGLAAAYHLALKGHNCTILDRNRKAGGSLLKEVSTEELPADVLQHEISLIGQTGVAFKLNTSVDAKGFMELTRSCDAVVVAVGKGESGVSEWGLPMHSKGVETEGRTYRIGDSNVFVVGSALKPSKMAIRVLGQGKEVAFSVDQFLAKKPVSGEKFIFNSRFGKLLPGEYAEYLKESKEGVRLEPEVAARGFSAEQVMEEARRCLHCDCRDLQSCKLRAYSDEYHADQKRFRSEERLLCRKLDQHDRVIYEPSKCIKCGICVRITEKYKEDFGLTFIGRGFDVVIGIPFNETLRNGLKIAADEVVTSCPTGALSLK